MSIVSSIDLSTDTPHTPERTQQLAEAAAEIVRCLNYATMPGRDGLLYPGDVYELLGTLDMLTLRLPQLCDQIRSFLLREHQAAHVQEHEGGPNGGQTSKAILNASEALAAAAGSADELRRSISRAQSAIGSVRYVGPAR